MLDELESRIAATKDELRRLQAEARRIRRNIRLRQPDQRARLAEYRYRQKLRRAGVEVRP